ncbi:hypothetical protein BO86DRAFT_53572 [Aspergillus japonicus CBS 114.51]|uniref:Uncharacterized protein n=1 Tax=Aspergillus japonicus CBS 114.51 TaxID=1448312 RepID=A0A8T8X5G0_ASPJA|nr:hypothetical protein BO86DRAFT_53572 [Aspergillus japonicus CBS 114.51]RAH83190.1 hypothetical protein BO86DRAFT_53572 [Aspergillus japonicus CBS 114.51]
MSRYRSEREGGGTEALSNVHTGGKKKKKTKQNQSSKSEVRQGPKIWNRGCPSRREAETKPWVGVARTGSTLAECIVFLLLSARSGRGPASSFPVVLTSVQYLISAFCAYIFLYNCCCSKSRRAYACGLLVRRCRPEGVGSK